MKYFNGTLFNLLNHEINLVLHTQPLVTLQRNLVCLGVHVVHLRLLTFIACQTVYVSFLSCRLLWARALIVMFFVFTGKLTGCLMWFVTVWSPPWRRICSILPLTVMYCYACPFVDSKTVEELLKDNTLHISFGFLLFWRVWLAAPCRMNVNECTYCAGNWFFNPAPTISIEVSENGDFFDSKLLTDWNSELVR